MNYLKDMMSDETGTPSWFRHAATGVLIFAGWFTVRAVRGDPVPQSVWDYWLPISLTLLAGAGGPRMVQYLSQMGAAIMQRLRGAFSSTYRETEIQQQVSPIEDDPVPEKPVIM